MSEVFPYDRTYVEYDVIRNIEVKNKKNVEVVTMDKVTMGKVLKVQETVSRILVILVLVMVVIVQIEAMKEATRRLNTITTLQATVARLSSDNTELKQTNEALSKDNDALREELVNALAHVNTLEKQDESRETTISRGGNGHVVSLEDEINRLRETIAIISASKGTGYVRNLVGTTPDELDKYEFTRDLGMWKTTYYSPTKEECGNTNGIGASGKTVVPGLSCAIDPKYWKFGTMFYVEGFGIVRADDTGSAIKGRERMDLCVLNNDIANQLGVRKQRVWLVKEKE